GEVHDLQDAEDHGQADGHERVEQAHDEAVHEEVESEQSGLLAATAGPVVAWSGDAGRAAARPARPSQLAGLSTLSIISGSPGTWISVVLLMGWFTSVSW